MSSSLSTERQSLEAIHQRTRIIPRLAIVLGSGLGNFTSFLQNAVAIPYDEIPFFPKLTAAGHAGELVIGLLGETPVVAMRGRAHLYEGHDLERATYGIRVMQSMGANTLIVSNAAGGLNPRFQVGDLVSIDGHINLMWPSVNKNNDAVEMDVPLRSGPVYNPSLIAMALETARRLGHPLNSGVYLATLGPTYETRSEYRAFRFLGADMVGMSTVPETILAASLGMRVAAFSVITNVAKPDSSIATSHEHVLEAANSAQQKLVDIIQGMSLSLFAERTATMTPDYHESIV